MEHNARETDHWRNSSCNMRFGNLSQMCFAVKSAMNSSSDANSWRRERTENDVLKPARLNAADTLPVGTRFC
jgi:hypothetical protein